MLKKEHPRIVFYGTPEFAVATLRRIVKEGYPVAAVVTAPDKPAGRGLKMTPSPVKQYALDLGIPVLQPEKLKDPVFLEGLAKISPDIQVVVAFRMMPKEVWGMPPLGTFNLHASLLPQYRGAAPINRAVINGETTTGVTTFFLQEQIDTGNIIMKEETPVGPDETAGELHDRLMEIGAGLVVKTLDSISRGTAIALPQENLVPEGSALRLAPKFSKEDCRILWDQDLSDVYNLIRGMSPYPGAFTTIPRNDGSTLTLKILNARAIPGSDSTLGPGSYVTDGKTFLRVAARDGWIEITRVQPAGHRVMDIREFLNGFGKYFV